jgi:hypothetical protein
VDCIGWTKDGSSGHPDQFDYFSEHGFMDEKDYPYCTGGPTCKGDHDPPVPGHPCAFDKSKAIPGTAGGKFTNTTGGAPSEDQMLAFLYKNGPVNTGINANVFGLREKGCESKAGSCFITPEMCNKTHGSIDHSILLTGYGTDPENGGDYCERAHQQQPSATLTCHQSSASVSAAVAVVYRIDLMNRCSKLPARVCVCV